VELVLLHVTRCRGGLEDFLTYWIFPSLQTGMTAQMFDAARERGTAQKIGQLNPMGRYGVAEGK
jgi:hypothetical protein